MNWNTFFIRLRSWFFGRGKNNDFVTAPSYTDRREHVAPTPPAYSDVYPAESVSIFVDDTLPDFLKNDGQAVESAFTESQASPMPEPVQDAPITQPAADEVGEPADEEGDQPSGQETVYSTKTSQNILDNTQLVTMFEKCGDILKYLDRISPGFQSEDSKDLMLVIREQLIQAMVLSGGDTINNEKVFNLLRHRCKEEPNAMGGEEILETTEPGIMLGDRVIVRADVKLKKTEQQI